jgi:hypothetical protein
VTKAICDANKNSIYKRLLLRDFNIIVSNANPSNVYNEVHTLLLKNGGGLTDDLIARFPGMIDMYRRNFLFYIEDFLVEPLVLRKYSYQVDKYGDTALTYFIKHSDMLEPDRVPIIKKLLQASDPTFKNADNKTALQLLLDESPRDDAAISLFGNF